MKKQFVLTLANMKTGDLLTFGPFDNKAAAHVYAKQDCGADMKPWRYNVTELKKPL